MRLVFVLSVALSLVTAFGIFLLAAAADGPAEAAPPRDLGASPTDADFARHVEALKARLPEKGKAFTFVVQRPFVVIGNEKAAVVRRRAVRTVKWAADRLKRDYFEKDPEDIVDIYLLADDASYRRLSLDLFGHESTSRYGYYSHTDRALVMNIATGSGTLVHEMVHAFMDANFPACPTWFNEGLASLYEQCGDKDGHIVGFTNWRLPALQEAIEKHDLPSFEELCTTTSRAFYGGRRTTNYAQARYLFLYLQAKGLLHAFAHAFMKDPEEDPTGYRTLVRILDEKDMATFQKRWEAWALTLRFPDPPR